MEQNDYFTIKEAAKRLHLSERHVRQRCIDNKIPGAYKALGGRKWLIPINSVNENTASSKPVLPSNDIIPQYKPKDPLVIEAQRQHFQDMLQVIKEWAQQIDIPPLFEAHIKVPVNLVSDTWSVVKWQYDGLKEKHHNAHWRKRPNEIGTYHCNIERDNPELFEAICQHIPELNEIYDNWRFFTAKLILECTYLRVLIRDKAKKDTSLDFTTPPCITIDFTDYIHHAILFAAEIDLGMICKYGSIMPKPNYTICPSVDTLYQLRLDDTAIAEGQMQLMEDCLSKHKEMMRYWEKSEKLIKLKELRNVQWSCEHHVQRILKEFSLKHIFPGACNLCSY
jgi:excisionase family DNA binding protein